MQQWRTPRRFSGASWPNFYTAVGPHRHGQYLRAQFNPEDYRYKGHRPDHDRVPAFWTDGSWQDKRVAVINMPYAPIHEGLNGIQVVNWGVHDYHHRKLRTWPASLADEVLSRYGGDPVGRCEVENRSPAEFFDFREKLLRRIRAKRDMICHYLQSEPWDLFVSVLDETHCVGHQTWHIHDHQHPRHDPDLAAALGDPIKDVYKEIDNALASVLDCVDDDCVVLFISTHGMGPTSDGNGMFEDILRRIEGASVGIGPQIASTIKRVHAALPGWLSDVLRPIEKRVAWGILQELRRGERGKRAYFSIQTEDPTAGVRINLSGREKAGVVQPGAPLEELIEHLTRELYALVDGTTGKPVVGKIMRREEVDYRGYEGEPPDLVVEWAIKDPRWIESPSVGRVDPVYNSRTGDHRMLGFVMASGPTVLPVQLDRTVKLEDLGLTIVKLLGTTIADTDGEIILEIAAADKRREDSPVARPSLETGR